jgi:hypothetical protein
MARTKGALSAMPSHAKIATAAAPVDHPALACVTRWLLPWLQRARQLSQNSCATASRRCAETCNCAVIA